MREARRAAQEELAHNRMVAAIKELLSSDDEKVRELEDLNSRRLPAQVRSLYEKQIMAEILEDLAGIESPSGAEGRFVDAAPSINKDSSTDPAEERDVRTIPVATIESAPSSGDYPQEPLDQDTAEALDAAGYDSADKIRSASDEELLDIKGIGPKKLEEIRAKVG